MGISEADRHDLYTGRVDLLGPDRAEKLMAYLPAYDPDEIATKVDLQTQIEGLESRLVARIERVEADIGALRADLSGLRDDLRTEMASGFTELNRRMDRLFQTVVGGLFVIVAAMATVMLTAFL